MTTNRTGRYSLDVQETRTVVPDGPEEVPLEDRLSQRTPIGIGLLTDVDGPTDSLRVPGDINYGVRRTTGPCLWIFRSPDTTTGLV